MYCTVHTLYGIRNDRKKSNSPFARNNIYLRTLNYTTVYRQAYKKKTSLRCSFRTHAETYNNIMYKVTFCPALSAAHIRNKLLISTYIYSEYYNSFSFIILIRKFELCFIAQKNNIFNLLASIKYDYVRL